MWSNLQTLPHFNPQQEKISYLFGCVNVYIWEYMNICTQIVCVWVCVVEVEWLFVVKTVRKKTQRKLNTGCSLKSAAG